jgi:YVTN family beta-propeller protein
MSKGKSTGRLQCCRGWLIAITVICGLLVAERCFAALGGVAASLPFQSFELIADPNQPYVYASAPAKNAIEVIDTRTLTVTREIALGTAPRGMALSANGQSLFVTKPAASEIAVIDTQTLQVTRTIPTPSTPYDVAAGVADRLYVIDAGPSYARLQQLDPMTGAVTGGSFPTRFYYYGSLQISPDLQTLYYGEYGLSPSDLTAFDVAGTTPSVLRTLQTGFNGKNVTLSRNGKWIAHPNGSPYAVTILNADTFTAVGVLNTGTYPGDMAFSPDNRYAYANRYSFSSSLIAYDTSTFASVGQFAVPDEIFAMTTDSSGQRLYASFANIFSSQPATLVYFTGVPEPAGPVPVLLVLASLTRRRR